MIDAHLHLQDERFSEILPGVVEAMKASGIRHWAVNGTGPEDWNAVQQLANRYQEVIPGFGVHPWKANQLEEDWESPLREQLESRPNAFVGEIGLDKWIRDHDLKKQKRVFLRQIEIANELSRPATVHCLRAWGHLLSSLRACPFSRPFLLHSFGGPREMIEEFVELGAYFSISGYFFRPEKAEKLESFSQVPLERILLETDAPDMLPPEELRTEKLVDSNGGEFNHPANLKTIYKAFTEWRGLPDVETTVTTMQKNFSQFLS